MGSSSFISTLKRNLKLENIPTRLNRANSFASYFML